MGQNKKKAKIGISKKKLLLSKICHCVSFKNNLCFKTLCTFVFKMIPCYNIIDSMIEPHTTIGGPNSKVWVLIYGAPCSVGKCVIIY